MQSFSNATNNARSLLRTGIFLLSAVLLTVPLGACRWFGGGTHDEVVSGTGHISAERVRFRRATKSFICLIANSGQPFAFRDPSTGEWAGIEPEIVRSLAKELEMEPVFVELPAEALSSALRLGRGDIAAGHLDTALIESIYLSPTIEYAPASSGKLALMTRPDDIRWNESLKSALKNIPTDSIISDISNTLNKAEVKVLQEGKDGKTPELSISVDLGQMQGGPAK